MTNRTVILLLFIFLSAGPGLADASGNYNFISAEKLKKRMDSNAPMIIIDICPAKQFAQEHIRGAIETNAYPVKKDAEKARLADHLDKIKSSPNDVIIICPRGGGGAKRTFDFYEANGIGNHRLLILEKGMKGWPYKKHKK